LARNEFSAHRYLSIIGAWVTTFFSQQPPALTFLTLLHALIIGVLVVAALL